MMNTLLVASCLLIAAEPEASEQLRPDPTATAGSEGETDIASTVSTIAENLRKADRGLSAGETGADTLAAQEKALEELQKLIDAAAKAKAQSDAQSSPSSAAAQQRMDASESSAPSESESSEQGSPQGGTAGRRTDRSSSSDENATAPAGSREVLQRFRVNVVRDAWGHLPQRLRDQLLNAGSDKYLPKYDALVRDYFESLAKPNADPPPIDRDRRTP